MAACGCSCGAHAVQAARCIAGLPGFASACTQQLTRGVDENTEIHRPVPTGTAWMARYFMHHSDSRVAFALAGESLTSASYLTTVPPLEPLL
eukprot:346254-Pelagomonas_calceolata.AAC.5